MDEENTNENQWSAYARRPENENLKLFIQHLWPHLTSQQRQNMPNIVREFDAEMYNRRMEAAFEGQSPLQIEYIIENILSFLKTEDLTAARLVCKTWSTEAAKLLIKKPSYAIVKCADSKYFFRCIQKTKYPGFLRGLDIEMYDKLNDEQVMLLIQKQGPHLVELKLGFQFGSAAVIFKALFDLLQNWTPNLKKLHLYYNIGTPELMKGLPSSNGGWQSFEKLQSDNLKLEELSMDFPHIIDETSSMATVLRPYFEECCSTICKISPRFKRLDMSAYPRLLTRFLGFREKLEKLVLSCSISKTSTWIFLSRTTFPNLRILHIDLSLRNIDFESINMLSTALRNMSVSLRDLSIEVDSYMHKRVHPRIFSRVLKTLPQLQTLTWAPTKLCNILQELEHSGIIHYGLVNLNLHQTDPFLCRKACKYRISTIKNSFPILKSLDLLTKRHQLSENTNQPPLAYQEFSDLSEFPYLEELRVTVDDFAGAFAAISELKGTNTLRHLTLINKVFKNDVSVNQEYYVNEVKRMLIELKNLNSIRLENFQLYFHEKYIENIVSFSRTEGIKLEAYKRPQKYKY